MPAAKSAISYVDGTKGILEYRGIPIESLAEKSNFEEICWLLLTGAMPTDEQLRGFRSHLVRHRVLPDKLVSIIEAMPGRGHPMDALQASMAALGMFAKKPDFRDPGEVDEACARILGATRTDGGRVRPPAQRQEPRRSRPRAGHGRQLPAPAQG